MSKRIYKIYICSKFTDISSIFQMDSFGNRYNNRSFLFQQIFDSFHEIVKIKCQLRKINQIRSRTVLSFRKSRRSGKPSGISSHDLNDRDKSLAVLQTEAVTDNLFYRCSNIFCRASVSRCVIRQSKVIVNCFRASDKSCRISHHNRVVGKLFDRIHGVISSDIDKCFNIQLVQNFKDLFIYFSVFMNFRKFVPAGSQICSRSSL